MLESLGVRQSSDKGLEPFTRLGSCPISHSEAQKKEELSGGRNHFMGQGDSSEGKGACSQT